MKIPVLYLAHPVGSGPDRTMNLASAKMWIRALIEIVPDVAFNVPWLPYCEVLAEDLHRDRGIRDDLIMIDRCDAIVAVGGRFSPGMRLEWDHMIGRGRPRIDLTREPLPGILTFESYRLTQTAEFRAIVTEAFHVVA